MKKQTENSKQVQPAMYKITKDTSTLGEISHENKCPVRLTESVNTPWGIRVRALSLGGNLSLTL